MTDQKALMKEIMAYSFAAYEWNLYLDTHPDDKMALEMFQRMAEKAVELKENLQSKLEKVKGTPREEEFQLQIDKLNELIAHLEDEL